MSRYTVMVYDDFGHPVTTLVRPQNKRFTLSRNKSGSCQFTLDLFDPQATSANLKLNQYDIVFFRDNTPVFAGQISLIHPTIDGDRKQVEVTATGYFDLFDQRFVTDDFAGYDALQNNLPLSDTDAATVAWDLIDWSQFPLTTDGSQKMTGTTTRLAQSFVAPKSANLSTLKLLLENVSATGNLSVALYPDIAGQPSSVAITNSSKTIDTDDVSSDIAWQVIDYSDVSIALTAGTTYWIMASLDTAQTGTNGVNWHYLNDNMYLAGKAFSPDNKTLFSADQDLQFFVLLDDNSYQMTKNTYWGIQQGNLPTSYDIAPTYDQYKKIKDAVEDIAGTYNGIDFAVNIVIDPQTRFLTKFFDVYYPKQGIDNTRLVFSYPGNIKSLDKPKDGKTMVNEAIMRGQGYGTEQVVETEQAAASIQSYGLRQDVEQQADVSDTATLTSIGREIIRIHKDPLDLPKIVLDGNQRPSLGEFNIGDRIRITLSGIPLMQDLANASYRIEMIEVTIDDEDVETVSLTVSVA